MIVCLCHRISDRDIAAAVADGVTCFEVLQDETLVASSCGSCDDCARATFESARASVAASPVGAGVVRIAAERAASAQPR